ncbi:hypothetical protein K438DRAFT_1598856 [Mycena galopus ATCC 62051]|nr:hypothetical protein K438DRAFT_1598856 [Mycena galopus ATCC 62051]
MPKGLANPRGRGPYSAQACTICRSKKSKCDGEKPLCGSCRNAENNIQCSWGRDKALKKPRTEAYFEALRKRADSLQAYVDLLEERLAKCVCQDVASHLQFRPQPEQSEDPSGEDSDMNVRDSDDDITQELTVPTQRLKARSFYSLSHSSDSPLLHGAFFKDSNSSQNTVSRIPEAAENPNASYVLQVDGMDVSQSHPDIDWSRHLPPQVTMNRREHDEIMALGLKYQMMFPIIPSLFLRDMYRALSIPRSEKPPPTPHYSPMLHNAVLSVSAAYSDSQHLRDPKTRRYFVQTAQACFDFKKPNPSMVHALSFIAAFYTECGDRIPAELYFGMSLILEFGLSDDVTEFVKAGLITHDEMVARNSAYWAVFNRDVVWALFWGREFSGPPRRNTPMPSVESDLDQTLWDYAPTKLPPQMNYETLIFFESSALAVIACEIAGVVCVPLLAFYRPVHSFDSNNLRLSTQLNLVQQSDTDVDHVKLCTRAAENVLDLVDTWSSLYTMRLASIKMAGVIFSAGTVFFLRALQATGSSRVGHGALNTALSQVDMCIRHLYEMGNTWDSAMRTGDMLQVILNQRLKPAIARRLARRGKQNSAAAASETQALSAAGAPHEKNPSHNPSYSETDSQLDPAAAWSDMLLDLNFFAQMQHTPAQLDLESSYMHETTFPEFEMNGFFLPDSFYAPEEDV